MSLVTALLFRSPPPQFHGEVRVHYIERPKNDNRNGGGGNPEKQKYDRAANTQRVLDAVKKGLTGTQAIADAADVSICTARVALRRLEAEGKVKSTTTHIQKTAALRWEIAGHA